MDNTNKEVVGYVLCMDRGDYLIDLSPGKVYAEVKPKKNDAGRPSVIRIIDNSQEDYLYPRSWFIPYE